MATIEALKPRYKRRRSCLWLSLTAFIGTCLLLAVVLAYKLVDTQGSAAIDLGFTVCAGITAAPSWQIGVAWYNPLSSNLPPIMISPYKLCFETPYNSIFQDRLSGQIAFPP